MADGSRSSSRSPRLSAEGSAALILPARQGLERERDRPNDIRARNRLRNDRPRD
ncbi:hypothetical protein AKJ09_08212 [Labilithrix luteola]|uniref:Uncharacterized protein n=1 Tax=Labilithrix luteola TaxID=1391654 RepID=A0A0K1Q747_9BACT|nr:hypothetical protein AKJ09_08212 [Labilithrix luteola]